MNIAISGASGFIGKHLTEYLTEAGHRVVPLGRPMFREGTSGHLFRLCHIAMLSSIWQEHPLASGGHRNTKKNFMTAGLR